MTAHGPQPFTTDIAGQEWREQAACRDADPTAFDAAEDDPRVYAALYWCGRCPVRAACLADAYATGDQWTVRGGTTGEQRVAARRRRLRAQHIAREVTA